MLEKDLLATGLNEKEIKVYIAALELGQATVQMISRRCGVNRATTYFIIDQLAKKGLMTSFVQGKKQLFSGADPERLAHLLAHEKQVINDREEALKRALPELQALKLKTKPVVRYYEGREGAIAITEEFLKKASGDVFMAYPVEKVNAIMPAEERGKIRRRRILRNIQTKVIYTIKEGYLKNTADGKRYKVPAGKFPLNCDISIYGNILAISTLDDSIVGVIIDDENIANTMRSIFKLALEAAENYDEKEQK